MKKKIIISVTILLVLAVAYFFIIRPMLNSAIDKVKAEEARLNAYIQTGDYTQGWEHLGWGTYIRQMAISNLMREGQLSLSDLTAEAVACVNEKIAKIQGDESWLAGVMDQVGNKYPDLDTALQLNAINSCAKAGRLNIK